MGIQPIDLQNLYMQLEKVGKTQVQQQVAAQAEQEAEKTKNLQNAEKKLKTVQETDAGNEQTGIVHEKNENSGSGSSEQPEQKAAPAPVVEEKTKEEKPEEVIRDPALGSHIDISG